MKSRYALLAVLYILFAGAAVVAALRGHGVQVGAFALGALGFACFAFIFFQASRRKESHARR